MESEQWMEHERIRKFSNKRSQKSFKFVMANNFVEDDIHFNKHFIDFKLKIT